MSDEESTLFVGADPILASEPNILRVRKPRGLAVDLKPLAFRDADLACRLFDYFQGFWRD